MSTPTRKHAGLAGIVVAALVAALAGTLVAMAPEAEAAQQSATTQQQEESAVVRADLEREIARLREALAAVEARQQDRISELQAQLEEVMSRLRETTEALQSGQGALTEEHRRRLEESMVEAARQLEAAREIGARRVEAALAEMSRRTRAEREAQARRLEEAMERTNRQVAEIRERTSRQAEQALVRSREVAERAREIGARAARQARAGFVYGRSRPFAGTFIGCEDLAEQVLDEAEDLSLSDQQVDAIRDLQRQHRRERIDRQADLEIAEMDLEDLRGAEPMDLTAIEAKLREVADLQVQSSMASLRVRQAVLDLLGPEQREQLDEVEDTRSVAVVAVGGGRVGGRLSRIGC